MNNPFTRFHESVEQYPDLHDDIDDVGFVEFDQWERMKKFGSKEGTTVGDTTVIPP